MAFKEKYSYKPSNLNIFNSSDIFNLIGKYPLAGKEYVKYADAFLAVADFDSDSVDEYPYKDFFYKEQPKKLEN